MFLGGELAATNAHSARAGDPPSTNLNPRRCITMLGRKTAVLMLLAYGFVLALAVAVHAGVADTHRGADGHTRGFGDGEVRFDGAGPERWAQRFRRERRAVIALRHELAAKTSRVVWLVSAFQCVHRYEGSWTANTGNGYRGGLQFGSAEWARYGGRYAPSADLATPSEQIAAGIAYHAVAGFWPWPNTARACGLIR